MKFNIKNIINFIFKQFDNFKYFVLILLFSFLIRNTLFSDNEKYLINELITELIIVEYNT